MRFWPLIWHSTLNVGDFRVAFARLRFAVFVIAVLASPSAMAGVGLPGHTGATTKKSHQTAGPDVRFRADRRVGFWVHVWPLLARPLNLRPATNGALGNQRPVDLNRHFLDETISDRDMGRERPLLSDPPIGNIVFVRAVIGLRQMFRSVGMRPFEAVLEDLACHGVDADFVDDTLAANVERVAQA